MFEEWRGILGLEGYEVSSYGGVRSYKNRFGLSRNPHKIKPQIHGGYYRVQLMCEGRFVNKSVHRLVLEAFKCPKPKGMVCCHNDGNRTNNHINNLRWDTHKNNSADMVKHGTKLMILGSNNGQSKLQESDIPEIIRLRKVNGKTYESIGCEYGVTGAAIRLVIIGETWNHISGVSDE